MLTFVLQTAIAEIHTLALWMPSGGEWIILLVLGLLIFGKRLPEVGRSLGKGIVEFKKGIRGIEDEIDEESTKPARRISEDTRQELPPRKTQPRERMESDDEENPYATVEEPRREQT